MNYKSKRVSVKQTLILSSLFLLVGCSDIISGTGHVMYGITTILMAIIKIIGVLLIIALVIGVVKAIIQGVFGG